MSYRCQSCGKQQPPGTRSTMVMREWRVKHYPFREGALAPLPDPPPVEVDGRFGGEQPRFKGKNRKANKSEKPRRDDPGGTGWEISQELRCCPSCAERVKQETTPPERKRQPRQRRILEGNVDS